MNQRAAYPLVCIAAIAAALLTVAAPVRAGDPAPGCGGLSASTPAARAPAAESASRTRSTCASRHSR
jgi:hypothetical protein